MLMVLLFDAAIAAPGWLAPDSLPAGWPAVVPLPAGVEVAIECRPHRSVCTATWRAGKEDWARAYRSALSSWSVLEIGESVLFDHHPHSLSLRPGEGGSAVELELSTSLPAVLPTAWPAGLPSAPGNAVLSVVAESLDGDLTLTWNTDLAPDAALGAWTSGLSGWTKGAIQAPFGPALEGYRRGDDIALPDAASILGMSTFTITWISAASTSPLRSAWVDR